MTASTKAARFVPLATFGEKDFEPPQPPMPMMAFLPWHIVSHELKVENIAGPTCRLVVFTKSSSNSPSAFEMLKLLGSDVGALGDSSLKSSSTEGVGCHTHMKA
jgi:hypothetical protein